MKRSGISRFVGHWVNAPGYCLRIEKVRKDQALVDFFDPGGNPIQRPYMLGTPTVQMTARYDDYTAEFCVDLWEAGKGFQLHLDYEAIYDLNVEPREALVPSLSCYEEDYHSLLEKFAPLFGPLKHFVRKRTAEPDAPADSPRGF